MFEKKITFLSNARMQIWQGKPGLRAKPGRTLKEWTYASIYYYFA